MAGQRFRRLTDLFVHGGEVLLHDGTYLWMQVVNAYERDECISDAQVGRARVVLTLKQNDTERMKIQGRLIERGRQLLVEDLVTAKVDTHYPDVVAKIEDDPDWTEKLAIIRRTDFTETAVPGTLEQRAYVNTLVEEWAAAIKKALEDERDHLTEHYSQVSEDELVDDYLETWLERRGAETAAAEYALTELWYATRYCEGKPLDGVVDHSDCQGHTERVFDTRGDVRSAPEALTRLLSEQLAKLAMAGRDPKGSASAGSSSASSATPSEAVESTPSTSTETPDEPPGTSSQPSTTP